MTAYQHTQPGTLIRWTLGLGAALCIALASVLPTLERAPLYITVAVGLALTACVFVIHSLTTRVTDEAIEVWFGPGWIRKRLPLELIESAAVVRNHWLFGWGIRWIPRGWLWNVSGLDAVELRLRNGRVFRIGTDQPRELHAAIEAAHAQRTTPSSS